MASSSGAQLIADPDLHTLHTIGMAQHSGRERMLALLREEKRAKEAEQARQRLAEKVQRLEAAAAEVQQRIQELEAAVSKKSTDLNRALSHLAEKQRETQQLKEAAYVVSRGEHVQLLQLMRQQVRVMQDMSARTHDIMRLEEVQALLQKENAELRGQLQSSAAVVGGQG